jgi:hypothetical protein
MGALKNTNTIILSVAGFNGIKLTNELMAQILSVTHNP